MLRNAAQTAKAIADPNRLRILSALDQGELCVCQLAALLQLAFSSVSRHLSLLYQTNLIDQRKDGRWVYYRINETSETPADLVVLHTWWREVIKDDPQIACDNQCLEKLRVIPMDSMAGANPENLRESCCGKEAPSAAAD